MSADLLREAASKMRERAEAATEVWGASRWEAFDAAPGAYEGGNNTAAYLLNHVATANEHGSVLLTSPWPDAEIVHHAASWHPAVALAVADWLEAAAGRMPDDCSCSECLAFEPEALSVARAYLGSDR